MRLATASSSSIHAVIMAIVTLSCLPQDVTAFTLIKPPRVVVSSMEVPRIWGMPSTTTPTPLTELSFGRRGRDAAQEDSGEEKEGRPRRSRRRRHRHGNDHRMSLGKRRSPFKLHNPNPDVFEDQDVYDRRRKRSSPSVGIQFNTKIFDKGIREENLLGSTEVDPKLDPSDTTIPKKLPQQQPVVQQQLPPMLMLLLDKNGVPRRSVSRISQTDAGTLLIRIPSKGMSKFGVLAGAATTGLLIASNAWVVASILGSFMTKSMVLDPNVGYQLEIGTHAWEFQKVLAGTKVLTSLGGATAELGGVAIVPVGVPTTTEAGEVNSYKLELYRKDGVHGKPLSFGQGLAVEELQYLAGLINDHLDELRGDTNSDTETKAGEALKELKEFDEKKKNKDGFFFQ